MGARVTDEFALHHALARRDRLLELGMHPSSIDRRRAAGEWISDFPGIYRHTAAPVTAYQSLLAAVWAGGPRAIASHRSAAWLWGMLDVPPSRPEVTVPKGGRPLPGVIRHQSTDLEFGISSRRMIPTTNPLRTLLELGALGDLAVVEQALDRGRAARLITPRGLNRTLEEFGRAGRNGTRVLRTALERFGASAPGRAPTVLESGLGRIFVRYNLWTPVPEFVTGPRGEYRIDFAYPHIKMGMEGESLRWHGPLQQEADQERHNALTAYGWTMLYFGWRIIHHRPDRVAHQIEARYLQLAAALEELNVGYRSSVLPK
jgi:hypothetical protein